VLNVHFFYWHVPNSLAFMKSNTRLVPVDYGMFAPPSSGVTVVGPDDQIWQGKEGQTNLLHVDRSAVLAAAPPLDAADFPNEFRLGSNRKLYQSVVNSSGKAKWEPVDDLHPETVMGFKLPRKSEQDAVIEDAALDEQGLVLGQFVGSYASYWRVDAIRAYWNGVDFYSDDGKYLNCPDIFKRGMPATMGLDGLIYIPRESYIEDLLIPETVQESSTGVYHKRDEYAVLNVADGAPGSASPAHCHRVTFRKVGDQTAKKAFESAWSVAIFEVVDLYSEPRKSYEERRMILETTVKPLQDAYKHLRLLPVNPILSKAWAQNVYDQLPADAALVFIDPSSKYDGATAERGLKPRRKVKKVEQGAPLVGWKLDASGRLDTLIVEGTDENKSAISVGEGNLWVCDKSIYDSDLPDSMDNAMKHYQQKMSQRESLITMAAENSIEGGLGKRAKEAFRRDAEANAMSEADCLQNKNENIEEFIAEMCAVPGHVVNASVQQYPASGTDQKNFQDDHCVLGVVTEGTGTVREHDEIARRLTLIEILRMPMVGYAPTQQQRLIGVSNNAENLYTMDRLRRGFYGSRINAESAIVKAINASLELIRNRTRDDFDAANAAIVAAGGQAVSPPGSSGFNGAFNQSLLAEANRLRTSAGLGSGLGPGDPDLPVPTAGPVNVDNGLRRSSRALWSAAPSTEARLGAVGPKRNASGYYLSAFASVIQGLLEARRIPSAVDTEANDEGKRIVALLATAGTARSPGRLVTLLTTGGDPQLDTATTRANDNDRRIKGQLLAAIAPSDGQSKLSGNIHAWVDKQRSRYAELFPVGCLVHYKMLKGDKMAGEQDSYYMTRVVIV
jgi:hypothetical protein